MASGVYTHTSIWDFKKPGACYLVTGAPGLKFIKVGYACIQNCIPFYCHSISTSKSFSCRKVSLLDTYVLKSVAQHGIGDSMKMLSKHDVVIERHLEIDNKITYNLFHLV